MDVLHCGRPPIITVPLTVGTYEAKSKGPKRFYILTPYLWFPELCSVLLGGLTLTQVFLSTILEFLWDSLVSAHLIPSLVHPISPAFLVHPEPKHSTSLLPCWSKPLQQLGLGFSFSPAPSSKFSTGSKSDYAASLCSSEVCFCHIQCTTQCIMGSALAPRSLGSTTTFRPLFSSSASLLTAFRLGDFCPWTSVLLL